MSDETTDSVDLCCRPVRSVVHLARDGIVDDHERRTLLDALGHGGCVPRGEYVRANATLAEMLHQALHRAERAENELERVERERDALRDALRSVRDHTVGHLTRAARRERS